MNNEFVLSDMGAIAFLLARGFRQLRIQAGDRPGRLDFVFEDGARKVAQEYFLGGVICARQFSDSLRLAKALLYSHKSDGNNSARGGAR